MDISALLKEPVVLGGGGFLVLVVLGLLVSRAVLKSRVAELEKKIDDIRGGGAPFINTAPAQFNSTASVSGSGDFMAEVERLVRANQLIQAIKLYRENSGIGLKESKDAIDAMKRQLNS